MVIYKVRRQFASDPFWSADEIYEPWGYRFIEIESGRCWGLLFGTCQGHSEDFVGPGVATTLRRNPSMLVIIIFGCLRYAIRTRARAARNERTEATPPPGGAYRARRGCFRAQVRTQTDGIRSQDAKTDRIS
uniref:Uncharacterized protein n=1 Tax=Tenebrio molitor TaxID=7067 RepID=A0A8J6L0I0_TENMO|nr:hypothetical protein GEV33_015452 [Tenebrio molitor]